MINAKGAGVFISNKFKNNTPSEQFKNLTSKPQNHGQL
jgi:hypothetical protein